MGKNTDFIWGLDPMQMGDLRQLCMWWQNGSAWSLSWGGRLGSPSPGSVSHVASYVPGGEAGNASKSASVDFSECRRKCQTWKTHE